MADGQVVFEITGDNKPIEQSLKDTTQKIKQESSKWDSAAKDSAGGMESSFVSAFKKIGAAAVAAKVGQALLQFGQDAIAAASDLQEVQNVVDVTFGDNASVIENWAKKAQSQFGLTEIQAKRFSSTIGAMMKSAGLSGDEVVEMSTDLAGLAADMASFYNMDFDTAFQKIRSGISGETEPLKQLGVNMSVANLEAFALQKGIKKTFKEMSQGEQTVLRYQYLMQATADAQGDFARTSESYANAQRRITTSFESIKASVGEVLLPAVQDATGFIADILESMTQPVQETIIDQFNDIDVETDRKIADILRIKEQAYALIYTLQELSTPVKNNSLSEFVSAFAGNINDLDGAISKAKNNDYAGTIDSLAKSLSKDLGGNVGQWQHLLTTIGDNAGLAIAAVSGDSGAVSEFLDKVAGSASKLSTDYGDYWEKLLTVLGDNAGAAIIALSGGSLTGDILAGIASGAGVVPDNGNLWGTLLGALKDNAGAAIKALQNGGSIGGILTSIADGAEGYSEDKSGLWKALLDAFGGNAEAVLAALNNNGGAGSVLMAIAMGANVLNANSQSTWAGLLQTLEDIDGISVLTNNSAGRNIEDLAKALSSSSPDADKAGAWKAFLDALGENTDALSALTGASAEETAAWLERMAGAADALDPADAAGWSQLMQSFVSGLPGLMGEGNSDEFFKAVTQNLLAMGSDSEQAQLGLMALGYSTEEIEYEQKKWLETCKRLVQTIPGLASIINTETGAVEGGAEAIREYTDAWEESQKKKALWAAYNQKAALLEERRQLEYSYEVDKWQAESALKRAKENFNNWLKENNLTEANVKIAIQNAGSGVFLAGMDKEIYDQYMKVYEAEKAAAEAEKNYQSEVENNAAAVEALQDAYDGLVANVGKLTDGEDDAAEGMTTLQKAAAGETEALEEVKTAVQEAADAFKAMDEYAKSVRDETMRSVSNVISGFSEVTTPAAQKTKDLTDQLNKLTEAQNKLGQRTEENKDQWESYENQIKSLNDTINEYNKGSTVSALGIKNALTSQINYINEYKAAMDEARRKGVSEEILASLSDGSQESYDYLKALSLASEKDIQDINHMYAGVQKESAAFVDDLTAQKLKADEVFDGLAAKAAETANNLNFGEEAKASVEATVQGIVEGLGEKKSAVDAQVDAIIASVGRLSSIGGGFSLSGGVFNFLWGLNGSHETGLAYVPFDHYLAELHEGEGILTAEENRVWQAFKTGGASTRNSFDYGAMSGAIWDNAPTMGGGNVYLDGQTVGRVISARQADSYRNLQRSGWQQ